MARISVLLLTHCGRGEIEKTLSDKGATKDDGQATSQVEPDRINYQKAPGVTGIAMSSSHPTWLCVPVPSSR